MITKEELFQIEEDGKSSFIQAMSIHIEGNIKHAAKMQRRNCEVHYHPLLDSFFEELVQGGLKIESRTLDKITLSW